ncbi:MAG: hypothetical protein J6S85_26675 [Methanobrevibacter sp.]|nr:hypothetical protein [Methanobrevibacter sp.]
MKKNEVATTIPVNAVCIGETVIPTGIVTKSINGKEVTCFESSFDMGGKTTTITCYDEKLAKDLSVLLVTSNVDAILGIRKALACANLYNDDNWRKVGDFKSFGEVMEKMFNIKRDTAVSYARVAKYFLIESDNENGFEYSNELYNGASLANMLQLLGMVEDDTAEPMRIIDKYILNGMLHITSSLRQIKSDMDDIRSLADYDGKGKKSGKSDKSGKSGSPDKGKTPEKSTAEIIAELLAKAEALEDDDKRQRVTDLLAEVGAILG